MSIDQDDIRRKRGFRQEIRPGTIPDEGAQELRSPEETSPAELALQQGVLPARQPSGDRDEVEAAAPQHDEARRHDEVRRPERRARERSESLGISRGTGGRGDVARVGGKDREQATTEYGANAEPDETGSGYVKGADPPVEGRDAPQG